MKRAKNTQEFVEAFLRRLRARGIKFCLLRNYNRKTARLEGRDVDILVEGKKTGQIRKAVKETAEDFGMETLFKNKGFSHQYYLLKDNREFIVLDLLKGIYWWGNQVIPSAYLLEKAVQDGNFTILKGGHQAFVNWVFPFLSGGTLKEKYRKEVAGLSPTEEFREFAEVAFGPGLAEEIITHLEREDFAGLKNLRRRARLRVLARNAKNPTGLGGRFVSTLYFVLREKIRPRGVWAAAVGPDGSGKTTLLQHLRENLEGTVFPRVVLFHWRPSLLPSLSQLFTGEDSGSREENIKNPHGAKPAGPLSSLFRLLYYSMDFLLGYFFRVRRKLYQGNLVLFDRYFHDLMVDPERSRISIPWILPGIIARLLPHPQIIFYLGTDPEVVYKRKGELPREKIREMTEKYDKICRKFKYCVKLDSSKRPEELARLAEKRIVEKWKRRLKAL